MITRKFSLFSVVAIATFLIAAAAIVGPIHQAMALDIKGAVKKATHSNSNNNNNGGSSHKNSDSSTNSNSNNNGDGGGSSHKNAKPKNSDSSTNSNSNSNNNGGSSHKNAKPKNSDSSTNSNDNNNDGVGNTHTDAVQAADNSQHASFGPGSSGNTADNSPTNVQTQDVSSGSSIAGGGSGGAEPNDGGVGNTDTHAVQAADNSQTAAFGPGSTGNTATNTPTNVQTQTVDSGAAITGGGTGYVGFGNDNGDGVGNTETTGIQAADNSQTAAFGPGSTGNAATNDPLNVQTQTINSGSAVAVHDSFLTGFFTGIGSDSNGGSVSVGNTETTGIQAADNSQTVAFGPGSTGNAATNTPTNIQDQTINSGSAVAVSGGGILGFGTSDGGIVAVGNTETTGIQAADNSQTAAFGPGSTDNAADNTPVNVQTQDVSSGAAITGGTDEGWLSLIAAGNTETNVIQAADNSQTVAFGPGSTGNAATNTPTNIQDQTVNSGAAITGGTDEGWLTLVGNTETNAAQLADNSQTAAFGPGSTDNTADNTPVNVQTQTVDSGAAITG